MSSNSGNLSNSRSSSSISSTDSENSKSNMKKDLLSPTDLENPKGRKPYKERIAELNNLINDDTSVAFDSDCLKKRINWSKSKKAYNLIDYIEHDDSENPEPKTILDELKDKSPKLSSLMEEIENLDAKDMKEHGKHYKHMIFTDMKVSNHGVRMIGSVLAAKGYTLGYKAQPNPEYLNALENDDEVAKKKEPKFKKINMLTNEESS